jgi:hypothetical protein
MSYAPASPGAEDYRCLADEIIRQEGAETPTYGKAANG